MLGKTNTPELGWKGDSGNRVFGPSFNPWNLAKTPGGSSGGAAAAVAAGLGPLAQGSDGAGSIRIPAAFCGIFGLQAVVWPGAAVSAECGGRPLAPWSDDQNRPRRGDDAQCDGRSRRARPALLVEWHRLHTRSRCRRARAPRCLVANARLCAGRRVTCWRSPSEPQWRFASSGVRWSTSIPTVPDPANILDVMWSGSMAGYFAGRLDEVRASPRSGIAGGDRACGVAIGSGHGARVATAQHLLHGNAPVHGLAAFDLLLTPTLPVTAFTAGLDEPDGWQRATLAPLDWTPFTFPFNLTGQPAATVPVRLRSEWAARRLADRRALARRQHGPSRRGRV